MEKEQRQKKVNELSSISTEDVYESIKSLMAQDRVSLAVILIDLLDLDAAESNANNPYFADQLKRTQDSIGNYEWYKRKPAKRASPWDNRKTSKPYYNNKKRPREDDSE